MHTHGKVPMFRMKPHKGSFITAFVVLIFGALCFFEGHRDPGDLPAQDRAHLVLAVCIVISGMLFIIATARMWFTHLWHDRYR